MSGMTSSGCSATMRKNSASLRSLHLLLLRMHVRGQQPAQPEPGALSA
jgi:hypothetical protein